MNKSTFEQELERTGQLVYTNSGDSMLPLIRKHRDLLVIKKVKGPLKKYDVPLYKRDSGEYVLHRILKTGRQGYVLCGDNRWSKEYGIEDRHIVGVLEAVIRDGRRISVTDRNYLIYVHLWCDLFYVRAGVLRLIRAMRRWGRR